MGKRVSYLVKRGDSYWARKAVPVALRPIVGKTELLAPLGSNFRIAARDVHAAVAVFNEILAEANAKLDVSALASPRMRARSLTITQIAQTHYAEELEFDRRLREGAQRMPEWHVEREVNVDGLPTLVEVPADDEPTNVRPLKTSLRLYQERVAREQATREAAADASRSGFTALSPSYRERQVQALRRVASGQSENEEMQAVVGWAVEKFQARGNTAVEPGRDEWRSLARVLAQVQLEALGAAIERDAGREPIAPKLPILVDPPTPSPVVGTKARGPAVSLLNLLDSYLRTLQAQGKGTEAERRWRSVFNGLVSFLGYDDARHLTKADLSRWRDHLLEVDGLAPKTVRDAHLASLRAVLGWAADNDKIPDNPAARIRIDVAKKVRVREKGLNDTEAVAVLKAALAYQPPKSRSPATRESAYITAAKRWVPWLCALTGARVAEMTQLRAQDVMTDKGITYLRITPEAGSVKSGHFRDVPVHPQLVSLGFLDFVRAAGAGALFYDAEKSRSGKQHPSKMVAGRVGTWVRSLGLIGEGVDPSHGWRHRFKTVGREAEISDRVLDAIQGHAGRTAGDDYGDVSLKTRAAAIGRILSYDI